MYFINLCNFMYFDNFYVIFIVNFLVWGLKFICIVCLKLEGLEMIGFLFFFNFLEFEFVSKIKY